MTFIDDNNHILTNMKDIKITWNEYVDEVFDNTKEEPQMNYPQDIVLDMLVLEVQRAIDIVKMAPAPDKVYEIY